MLPVYSVDYWDDAIEVGEVGGLHRRSSQNTPIDGAGWTMVGPNGHCLVCTL